jgi:hypothetical protein
MAPTGPRSFPASVLVLQGKGDPGYFHIPDEDTLHRTALNILTERLKSGHYYDDPTEDGPPEPPEHTEEQITALPEKKQAEARRGLKRQQTQQREYEHDLKAFESIRKAAQEGDGVLAWRILLDRSRRGYEYETVQLIPYCGRYHT